MPVPDITHLQFLLLTALLDSELPGRQLRALLEHYGHSRSAPAFYQMMARMEDAKLVKGRYEKKIVEGQVIKERVYKITASGTAACAEVREFYTPFAAPPIGGGVI